MAEPQRKIYPLIGEPAIQRDGTEFDTRAWTDGKWCRFYKGRPKKIGGCRMMTDQYSGLVRSSVMFSRNGENYIVGGSYSKCEQNVFDSSGWPTNTIADRTPVGFSVDANNLWQFAYMWDAGSSEVRLIGHAAPNLLNIDNTTTAPIYIGDSTSMSALTAITSSDCSGGIAVLNPYLFYFSSDGYIGWSVANQPTDLTGSGSGSQRITDGKIVRGLPLRAGAGQAPAGLFWGTTSLQRAQFVGGAPVFAFDQVSGDGYSILSSSAPVEIDGTFFWPGVDRFMTYNGIVREVRNDRNKDFFFKNLNMRYRQKVWGIKIPRWSEIWWFFPKGADATECNHAVIYNYGTQDWYDTPVTRVSGVSSQVFTYPVMFDTTLDASNKTRLFMHEYGVDEVVGASTAALESYAISPIMALPSVGPVGEAIMGEDRNIYLGRIEPDYVGSGNLGFDIYGRPFAKSSETLLAQYNTSTLSGQDQFFPAGDQERLLRVKVSSNEQGGDFHLGNSLMLMQVGDGRPA